MRRRSLPMPSICAPIATRQSARSLISGSRAALISRVSPSASAGGHQQVFGGADRDRRKGDLGAAQSFGRAGVDIAFAQFNLGPEPLQPLYVEIDRACADRAPARQ